MAEAPYWPVATDAFIADTTHLDAEQTGAYMMLLMSLWRSPEACLPDDEKKLCRMARVSHRKWHAVWDVIAEFFTVEDGFVTHKRVTSDRVKVREKIDAARTNGQRGGERKALKTKKVDVADATDPLEKNASETVADGKLTINHKPKDIPPNPLEGEFEEFYREYPKRVDRKKTERAYRATRKTVPHAQLMAGVRAYRDEVRGKDPQFIKHPTTWLNAGSWENSTTAEPTSQNYSDDMWETFLVGYAEGKTWPKSTRGPAPNEAGCQAPERLLSRYLNRFGNLEPGHLAQKGQAA